MPDKKPDAEATDFSVSVMDDCYIRPAPPPVVAPQRPKGAAKSKGKSRR